MSGKKFVALLAIALGAAGFLSGQIPPQAVDLYHAGKFQQAADTLAPIASSSNDAESHLWLGKCWLKLRKLDEAISELEKASQITPSDGVIRLWLGRAYGRKASSVSFFTAPKWARKVVQQFETAVKLSPRNLDARFDLLEYYLEAPGFLGGGQDRAEAEVKKIAEFDPRRAYTARARMLENDKKYDLAAKQLMSAVAEFPNDAGSFVDLAAFQLERKQYSEAAANAARAQAIDAGNLKAKFLSCAAFIALGRDIPNCERSLRQIIAGPLCDDSDPAFEEAYYWLGRAYQAEGMTAEARQAYRTSLTFDPEYQAAKSALSQVR
jgi:tetratricopeptide (TPR) repeat protein